MVLHAAEPGVVGADEADHRRRDGAVGVEAARLVLERDADEVEVAHRLAVASLTLRATYANALLWFDRRASSSAWSTCTIGASFAAYTIGSLIDARVGDDRRLRHRHRQHLAAAVEDVAALGRDGDGADALPEPERREVRAVARLEIEEAHADGRRTRARSPGRCRARAPGWAGAGGRARASAASWCADAPAPADRRDDRGAPERRKERARRAYRRARHGARCRRAGAGRRRVPRGITAAGGQGSASSSTSRRWSRRSIRRRSWASARRALRGTAPAPAASRGRGARPPGSPAAERRAPTRRGAASRRRAAPW